jgi:signal transduction histidine kinase/CheY-like chemotaxis protein
MKKLSEDQQREDLRQRIIGLGEQSLKKSYYPELQKQIRELERINNELKNEIQERKKSEELRQKLEFQLRQTQKMEAIGSLAGGIAHDFNNILSAVIGYAELAKIHTEKCQPSDNCPAFNDLNGILQSANRAKELVRQILSFSRQQGGTFIPVSVESIIRETSKMLRAMIPTTITIEQNFRTLDSTVLADPTQLHQVIMNIGTNAYQAMRETGGSLSFILSDTAIENNDVVFANLHLTPGPYIILRITDTGKGMDKGTQDKIFNPYFSTKREEGGTGLGLSVTHSIIAQHNGQISVYSEPGKGTTFSIYLPKLQPKTTAITLPAMPADTQKGHERLLIVDDEKTLLDITQRILENLGYTVTAVNSPEKALTLFQHSPELFDLLITDMNMPEMNGATLIKKIRNIRADIPVILCTGFSELMNAESTKALGSASHLMKPVTQKELHTAIQSLLGS